MSRWTHPPLRTGATGTPNREQPAPHPAPPVLRSVELFAHTREVLIEHAGEHYRLRLTLSNKLILTK